MKQTQKTQGDVSEGNSQLFNVKSFMQEMRKKSNSEKHSSSDAEDANDDLDKVLNELNHIEEEEEQAYDPQEEERILQRFDFDPRYGPMQGLSRR